MPWRSLLLAGAFLAGWLANGWRLGDQIAEIRADHAQALAASERRARQIESGWHAALTEVQKDARSKTEELAAHLSAAGTAADRLRERVAELSRRPAACPGSTGRGEAAEPAQLVLADVLSRIDERAGELAAYADRARIAGSACEVAYDLIYDTRK